MKKTLLEKYAEAKKSQLSTELKNCFLWSLIVLFMLMSTFYWFETGKISLGIIWAIMTGVELIYTIVSFISVHLSKQEYIRECEERLKELENKIKNNDN